MWREIFKHKIKLRERYIYIYFCGGRRTEFCRVYKDRYLQPNWTPWQKDTDSRLCVCESVQNRVRFAFLHIDIVDACTCSLQRLSHIYSRSEKFYVHTYAVFISQRSIERTGEGSRTVGFDQFEQTETKRKTKGVREREREGYCGLKIFQQHGSFGPSWSFNPFSSQSTFVRVKNGEKRENRKACVCKWEILQPTLQLFRGVSEQGVYIHKYDNRFPKSCKKMICQVYRCVTSTVVVVVVAGIAFLDAISLSRVSQNDYVFLFLQVTRVQLMTHLGTMFSFF